MNILRVKDSGGNWVDIPALKGDAGEPTAEQVQEAVDDYLYDHPTVAGTFPNKAKAALLDLLANVAYINGLGNEKLTTLRNELYDIPLSSISASFAPGATTIYNTDSLNVLRQYLTVTATFVDSSTMTVTDYTLSGTLAVGTNTITVGYADKTTTFSVTAADSGWDYYWDFTESLVDRVAGETAALTNLTRGASGITFAGSDAVRYIKLTDVFAPGKYVEIDLKEVNNIYEDFGNTASIVLFGDTWPWVNSVANGFGYHYSTSTSMNRFGFISSDSTHWGYSSISDSRGGPAYFDGNHTLKIAVNSSNEVSVFRDNEDMRIEYDGSPQTITDCNSIWIGMPSTTSSYMSFANMTVTGVRIRDLEVS